MFPFIPGLGGGGFKYFFGIFPPKIGEDGFTHFEGCIFCKGVGEKPQLEDCFLFLHIFRG